MHQDMTLSGGDVLVVDDDPTIIDLVTELLEDEGYRVRRASNGLDAWLAIQSAPPMLLVTDIRMPLMNGRELVTLLRAHGYHFPILIIAATPALAVPLVQFERTMYIAKPFELDVLLDGVRRSGALASAVLV